MLAHLVIQLLSKDQCPCWRAGESQMAARLFALVPAGVQCGYKFSNSVTTDQAVNPWLDVDDRMAPSTAKTSRCAKPGCMLVWYSKARSLVNMGCHASTPKVQLLQAFMKPRQPGFWGLTLCMQRPCMCCCHTGCIRTDKGRGALGIGVEVVAICWLAS